MSTVEAYQALLLYLGAWLAVTALLSTKFSDENGQVVVTPLMVMVRTPFRFKSFEKLREKRSIGLLLDTGIAVLAILMLLFYYMMVRGIIAQLETGVRQASVVPIIPGLTISIETFLYMLPGLWLAMLFHEAAHALAARYSGVDVKSSGLMVLLGLIPAAFVEPDEEQLEKAPTRAKLRVVSAGVLANTILFLVFLAVVAQLSAQGSYIVITPIEGSFAYQQLPHHPIAAEKLIVNNTAFKDLESFMKYMAELRNRNGGTLANTTIVLEIVTPEGRVYKVVKPAAPISISSKERKKYEMIGIQLAPVPKTLVDALGAGTGLVVYEILLYAELLNIGLAGINAAPLFITDGAQYMRYLAERRLGTDQAKTLANVVSALTLLLLLPNLAI